MPIHRRCPPTALHETFCLLLFSPGPVQFSLYNLDTKDSSVVPMLMPDLERTPDQHRTPATRIPDLKPSTNSSSGSSSHSRTRPRPADEHSETTSILFTQVHELEWVFPMKPCM